MRQERMIGLESYQAINTPKEWDEPSTEDYFEKFFSAWAGKEEVSDDDYEIVHRWWYEFKAGTGCDWDDGVDTELEEMKESLEAIDQRRAGQSCANCRRNGNCDEHWQRWCRTGNNDDYTLTDYWKVHRTDEEWEEEIRKGQQKAREYRDKYYEPKRHWHFTKQGDYPRDEKPVLCILGDVSEESYEVGYFSKERLNKPTEWWHFETYELPDDDGDNAWGVSAWQYIKPPKEDK